MATLIDSQAQINALAVASADSRIVYAATKGYGVFRSIDGGANWAPLNEGLTHLNVRFLALAPGTSNRLYAGTSGGVLIPCSNSARQSESRLSVFA